METELSATYDSLLKDITLNGLACLGISTGSRLGLFDGLHALADCKESAVTSTILADKMKFKERYVREWLNGMVCAKIVDHCNTDGEDKYWIEKYKCPSNNFWLRRSLLMMGLAKTHMLVESCFPIDGPQGTSIDDYPDLHEFLANSNGLWSDDEQVKKLLAADSRLEAVLKAGAHVLEVGCGAAQASKALAKLYPNGTYVATDISDEVLEKAKANCKEYPNISYKVMDACNPDDSMCSSFDLVLLVDVFHDVPYPHKLSSSLHKILKPDGLVFIIDMDASDSVSINKEKGMLVSALYNVGLYYCVPTSLYFPDSDGLGPCAGKEVITRYLINGGFKQVNALPGIPALILLASN